MSTEELLQKAIDFIIDLWGERDTFCTALLDIPKEAKKCKKNCNNLNAECVKRYLKYYNKS